MTDRHRITTSPVGRGGDSPTLERGDTRRAGVARDCTQGSLLAATGQEATLAGVVGEKGDSTLLDNRLHRKGVRRVKACP